MRHVLLLTFLVAFSLLSQAQKLPAQKNRSESEKQMNSRPKLFTNLASAGALKPADASASLNVLSKTKVGDEVQFPIAANTNLRGTLTFKRETRPGTTVMRLRISNYGDAEMFVVQQTTNGITKYHARVMHPKYSDALVLKDNAFQYVQLSKLVVE